MRNLLFIFILPFFLAPALQAQEAKPFHASAVHAEIGGMGGIYSLSWERGIGKQNWFIQPGMAVYGTGKYRLLIFPVIVKKTFGAHAHKLETGIGQGITFAFGQGFQVFPRGILDIGWRYQKENSPWIFRACYTPMISYIADLQYQHWGGISLGYQLNLKK